jgi:hypothetical protein
MYQALYGAAESDEYAEGVMEFVTAKLSGSEWVELERSEWEGGMEQSLLRRGEHCLTVLYDPVTRQLRFIDGKDELDLTLQLLAEDGVLVGEEGQETIASEQSGDTHWSADLLAAAEDALRGHVKEMESATMPAQATILGLHPHADGALRAPEAYALADRQLNVLLRAIGALSAQE